VYTMGDPNNPDLPQLNAETAQAIRAIPGVQVVIPIMRLGGGIVRTGDLMTYPSFIGLDSSVLTALGMPPLRSGEMLVGVRAGDYFTNPDAPEEPPVAVDMTTAPLELVLEKYSESGVTRKEYDLKAVGMLTIGGMFDYSVVIPSEDVIRYNEWLTGQKFDSENFRYDQMLVRTTSRETTSAVAREIRNLGFGAGGMIDYLESLNSYFSTMRLMLGGVGGVALLVAAFGVANTMTMAILERTKEIGVMKAIGATDRDVLTVFLIEAGLVGFSGGVAGVGLALFIQNVANNALANAPQQQQGVSFLPVDLNALGGQLFVIPPELLVGGILLATVVGLSAGFYPALRAARLTPVIALKQE
jgi:putative ABC transport system permease protein